MPEKSSVNDQKIENLLNLALDVTETERKIRDAGDRL